MPPAVNDLEVDDLDDLGADLLILGGDGGPKKSFVHDAVSPEKRLSANSSFDSSTASEQSSGKSSPRLTVGATTFSSTTQQPTVGATTFSSTTQQLPPPAKFANGTTRADAPPALPPAQALVPQSPPGPPPDQPRPQRIMRPTPEMLKQSYKEGRPIPPPSRDLAASPSPPPEGGSRTNPSPRAPRAVGGANADTNGDPPSKGSPDASGRLGSSTRGLMGAIMNAASAVRPTTPGAGRLARGYNLCPPDDAVLSAKAEAHWGGVAGDTRSCKILTGKVGVWITSSQLVIANDKGGSFVWKCVPHAHPCFAPPELAYARAILWHSSSLAVADGPAPLPMPSGLPTSPNVWPPRSSSTATLRSPRTASSARCSSSQESPSVRRGLCCWSRPPRAGRCTWRCAGSPMRRCTSLSRWSAPASSLAARPAKISSIRQILTASLQFIPRRPADSIMMGVLYSAGWYG